MHSNTSMSSPDHLDGLSAMAMAASLDEKDPLKHFRDRFLMPEHAGGKAVYFLGNSLGLQPRTAKDHINTILQDWSAQGVESFFRGDQPWIDQHNLLREPIAAIVGARPDEICIMNSLTVNLHLMLVTFYRPSGKRCKILCEGKAFPSDQYMLASHVRHWGLDPREVIVEVLPEEEEVLLKQESILKAIDRYREELALVMFSGVNYYTGQCFDMRSITAAAHAAGARVGFDLAHAAGNVPLQLHSWEVDFACWCHYKYLNAGPGAVGGVFIHERFHREDTFHRFAGWWGYDKDERFAMHDVFKPAPTAEGWQLSTPPIILLAALHASLDIYKESGISSLHLKREALTAFLWKVLKSVLDGGATEAFRILTPAIPEERGCQISLLFPKKGKEIFKYLTEAGFYVDWREPDVIRLAPVPLYNTFREVALFGETLHTALKTIG